MATEKSLPSCKNIFNRPSTGCQEIFLSWPLSNGRVPMVRLQPPESSRRRTSSGGPLGSFASPTTNRARSSRTMKGRTGTTGASCSWPSSCSAARSPHTTSSTLMSAIGRTSTTADRATVAWWHIAWRIGFPRRSSRMSRSRRRRSTTSSTRGDGLATTTSERSCPPRTTGRTARVASCGSRRHRKSPGTATIPRTSDSTLNTTGWIC
mmetsp:Transcript_28387/g.61688  ORF Transcript_28387/g.61688 Transcript_28387/m.61688 type:complete len:208 (+) Transcript_28387:172-795(+)